MVLKIMCWQMKEIYQIILELIFKKIRWDIQIIAIAPGVENYQSCWAYRVRKSQSNRDAFWKTITA